MDARCTVQTPWFILNCWRVGPLAAKEPCIKEDPNSGLEDLNTLSEDLNPGSEELNS